MPGSGLAGGKSPRTAAVTQLSSHNQLRLSALQRCSCLLGAPARLVPPHTSAGGDSQVAARQPWWQCHHRRARSDYPGTESPSQNATKSHCHHRTELTRDAACPSCPVHALSCANEGESWVGGQNISGGTQPLAAPRSLPFEELLLPRWAGELLAASLTPALTH